jgi:ribosome modulation factor
MSNSCDEAFNEGSDAFYKGLSETANPYASDTDEHLSWNDGWAEADNDNFSDDEDEGDYSDDTDEEAKDE